MSWKNTREVNPGVKVNLWLVYPQVNLSMEQSALRKSWVWWRGVTLCRINESPIQVLTGPAVE